MRQRWGQSHRGLRSWRCTADQVQRTSLPSQGPENKTAHCKVWYEHNMHECEKGGTKIQFYNRDCCNLMKSFYYYGSSHLPNRVRITILTGSGWCHACVYAWACSSGH